MALTITSVSPSTQKVGQNSTVTIKGIDFTNPFQIFVETLEPTEALQVVFKSSTEVEAIIPGIISRGIFDIRIRLNDGSEFTLSSAFAVVPATPLPDFARETFDTLMARLTQRMPAKYDTREGSTMWDMLAPLAAEFESTFVAMFEVLNNSFLGDATGNFLDLIALEHGLTRAISTKSTVTIKFTGTSALTVSAGFRVGTTALPGGSPIVFVTDADIGPLVSVGGGLFEESGAATADEEGAAGNVLAAAIDTLISSQTGLTLVTNAAAASGGDNEEGDGTFKSRIIRHVREPSQGGNKSDYVLWAKEIAGVGKVGVDPLFSGNGTVRVLILDPNDAVAPGALITLVQDHIDPAPASTGAGKAPIGATVTVASATLKNIDVSATIVIETGAVTAEVITAVEVTITAFLKALAIGGDVIFFELAGAIQDTTGVLTVTAYTVEAGGVDVVVAANEKTVADSLTITT